MSCLKILVIFIFAQCHGHHIYLQKGLNIQHDILVPPNILAYIHGKWMPYAKIETKSVIQKRESESDGENIPINAEVPSAIKAEVPPAPVIEHVEEKENLEAASSLFGFQRPEPSFNRVPLSINLGTGLNTNIRESLTQTNKINSAEVPVPQRAGEFFEGLPPRPIEPIKVAESEKEVPLLVPPPNIPAPAETPPPALFDRTRVRQYAVYAGDVILKYLSQFFNRARITFNRFTSPSPPTPVYEN